MLVKGTAKIYTIRNTSLVINYDLDQAQAHDLKSGMTIDLTQAVAQKLIDNGFVTAVEKGDDE